MTVRQRQIVSSGNFVVSKKQPLVLDAYLGSCVGVALWDADAGVGGFQHLLLPEPIDGGTPWQPEKYARTGLPLFIQALCDQGADKTRLKATLAGGGLIGPVSQLDLDLDIGGRTAEIVCNLLEKEKIPVIKREIGGFFGCKMSMDLSSGKTDISPLLNPSDFNTSAGLLPPTPGQLQETIQQIKPIPQVVLKLVRMLHDDKDSLTDMAKQVRQDQVISARVIQLCNTVFFSVKMKADSIDRALVLLGEKKFLQLVLSATMKEVFCDETHGYSLCKGGLYNHSVGMAMACEKMAQRISRQVSPSVAYTAGLLHDIGKVVLDQYVGQFRPYFYRDIFCKAQDFLHVEKAYFDTTHSEIGMSLARDWSLPDILHDPIARHHEPELARKHPELTCLVYLADLIYSRFVMGQELERMNTDGIAFSLKVLNIKQTQLPALIDEVCSPFHAIN